MLVSYSIAFEVDIINIVCVLGNRFLLIKLTVRCELGDYQFHGLKYIFNEKLGFSQFRIG